MKQLLLLLISTIVLFGHQRSSDLPIIVRPYYHYEFNSAKVGKFSKALGSKDSVAIANCISKMQNKAERLTVEQQFVAAIRLFDTGDTTSALYWYYTARYRMELFKLIADPIENFERHQAHVAFLKQIGRHFNKISHRDPVKLSILLEKILYEQRGRYDLSRAYPNLSFCNLEEMKSFEQKLQAREISWINHLRNKDE